MKQKLRQILSQLKKKRIIDAGRMPAAVLIPVYNGGEDNYILFTRRTDKVKNHKGQISFPGGAYEKTDSSLAETAIRESAEEIGLKAEDIEILGELDDFITTTSGFVISPFVGWIPWPYKFKADPYEIEEIIEIPIRALLDKNRLHEKAGVINDDGVDSFSYHYKGNVIWGATACILNQFLKIYTAV